MLEDRQVAWKEGATVASCQACGNECPSGAAFCAACGHRLGVASEEPINVNVRVDSACSSCLSCLTTAVAVVVLIFFVLWIFSC